MKTVLTIAGFDPSSGAGITADLMVFAAHGLFGISCITALTAQSTVSVRSVHPVASDIVAETLQCLEADLPPAGIKIGMISTEANVCAISRYIDQLNVPDAQGTHVYRPVVLDPVLRSSSGKELLSPAGIEALKVALLPLVDWVTPNTEELGLLSGESIATREDIPHACRALQKKCQERRKGPSLAILATGGHLDPPDDFVLLPSGEEVWLPGKRVVTTSTHGTGCALSSALLSRLVLGDSPEQAAAGAKQYVAEALRTATARGAGRGPMNHLWPLAPKQGG